MNLWHRISYFHDARFGKCCFREMRSAKKGKQHFLKWPGKKSYFRNTIHSLVLQTWHAALLIAALATQVSATVIVSSEKSYLEEKQISLAVEIVRATVLWSFIESITERFKQKYLIFQLTDWGTRSHPHCVTLFLYWSFCLFFLGNAIRKI